MLVIISEKDFLVYLSVMLEADFSYRRSPENCYLASSNLYIFPKKTNQVKQRKRNYKVQQKFPKSLPLRKVKSDDLGKLVQIM